MISSNTCDLILETQLFQLPREDNKTRDDRRKVLEKEHTGAMTGLEDIVATVFMRHGPTGTPVSLSEECNAGGDMRLIEVDTVKNQFGDALYGFAFVYWFILRVYGILFQHMMYTEGWMVGNSCDNLFLETVLMYIIFVVLTKLHACSAMVTSLAAEEKKM